MTFVHVVPQPEPEVWLELPHVPPELGGARHPLRYVAGGEGDRGDGDAGLRPLVRHGGERAGWRNAVGSVPRPLPRPQHW